MTTTHGSGSGDIAEVLVVRPHEFEDDRGSFRELFRSSRFENETGIETEWAQDSHAYSRRNVVRGIHYQLAPSQGKLVTCLTGAIFDVAVDLRTSSATFGKWVGVELSRANGYQLWIPAGFGHGYSVLSEGADVLYKATAEYNPATDRAVRWNDPHIGIDWRVEDPVMSERDVSAPFLADAEVFDGP